jgi:hypothetical protein
MKAKEKHEQKMIEYLSHPDNEWLNREDLASKVCGITKQTLYVHFTPAELSDIEKVSLKLRRSQYADKLAKVDQSLLKEAAKGDTAAAKLAYQRFEGWSEKQKHEVDVPGAIIIRGDDAKL